MSKTKKILPELRFPEFLNNETWADRKLSDVLYEHKVKSTGDEEVFSVSVHKGVVNQVEHLGRVFASSNTENYRRVFPGDIIYTKSPTGDFPFGIIKQSKVSKPVIVSPLYGVFKPETTDLGVILDAYFEYPERTINYLSSIVQKGAKNTINIHNDTFLSKSLVLPLDKREQSKIASFLLSIDELIATHKEKLELLKVYKKGLVQNLFPQEGEKVPKYRFNEFAKQRDWVKENLGELTNKIGSGITPSGGEKNYKTKGRYFIRSQNVGWGELLLEDVAFIDEQTHSTFSSTELFENDVLLNITGASIGRSTLANEIIKGGNVNQHVCIIRTNKKLNPSFLNQFLLSHLGQKQIDSLQAGGNRQGLNFAQIRSFIISLPSTLKEQQKIASCLSTLDEIIKAQGQIIEQLKQHKKGLMQNLFPKAID